MIAITSISYIKAYTQTFSTGPKSGHLVLLMKLVCAWCGSEINRSGYDQIRDSNTSHGVCPACSQALACEDNGLPLQTHINSIPIPILLVDSNNTILGMNEESVERLGSKAKANKGVRFGLVFDCIHSHRTEGCGRTIHCSGCVIRRSVAETFSTGESRIEVPATLSIENAESELALTITTVKRGNFVLMRVDRAKL